ncbi:hypothetical protein TNCV_565311 [Trichonephila clavipes]|nr:hypothetical protein TNCV_565311 [Trichonephila clavipes]
MALYISKGDEAMCVLCSGIVGYTDRADSSGNNVNDSEMANLPTDIELELALSQRNSTRTPSPQLTPYEQLKYNKVQLAKMETFRRCKQACVDALMMMPDHYPRRALLRPNTHGAARR